MDLLICGNDKKTYLLAPKVQILHKHYNFLKVQHYLISYIFLIVHKKILEDYWSNVKIPDFV